VVVEDIDDDEQVVAPKSEGNIAHYASNLSDRQRKRLKKKNTVVDDFDFLDEETKEEPAEEVKVEEKQEEKVEKPSLSNFFKRNLDLEKKITFSATLKTEKKDTTSEGTSPQPSHLTFPAPSKSPKSNKSRYQIFYFFPIAPQL
jgi:hypothetical protein